MTTTRAEIVPIASNAEAWSAVARPPEVATGGAIDRPGRFRGRDRSRWDATPAVSPKAPSRAAQAG